MTNKDSKANSSTKDSGNGSIETESGEPRYLLGQILVDLNYITVYQLDEALSIQKTIPAQDETISRLDKSCWN